jgi:hypothetical protein
MFKSSAEHVFACIERVYRRALTLVHGDDAPAATAAGPDDLHDREAASLAARVELRLPQLVGELGLEPLAFDLLVCLLVAEYEPFSRVLMRALQREHGRPWIELGTIAELLELGRDRMPELGDLVAADAPLSRWALIERDDAEVEVPLVALRLKIPSAVARFLIGDDRLPAGMTLRAPEAAEKAAPVAAGLLTRLQRAILRDEPVIVELVGRANTGRHEVACAIADHLGRALVTADLALVDGRRLEWRLAEARREARLRGALLCLRNWDTRLPTAAAPSEEGPAPSAPAALPVPLQRFFADQAGVVLLTAEDQQPLLGMFAHSVLQAAIPFPSPSERARLLAAALARRGLVTAPDVDLATVTRRFALDPQRIEVAARAATELTEERDPDARTVAHSELLEACRRQVRHDLKSLATRVITSHRWEDLVIPVDVYDSLIELISYVRHAHQVYDEWGFGGRHSLSEGVSALFAGPPGTGKTMCASVVARELDMELFRVDLSRVVSKWIGETEKNLSKVFDEAQHSNAIILFDEADSLFAKRTEVKSSVDRYANLEVNYLLQRMEAFGGVTILTTNFEDTIDTAFKRRLTFRMRFEKPDAEARAALWRKVFPSGAALAGDFDPDVLGRMYEMSGGSIRNAAVRAAFFAAAAGGAIDQAICVRAGEREAREMGILTHAVARGEERPMRAGARPTRDDGDTGDGSPASAGDPGSPERRSPASPPAPAVPPERGPRIIPVTHPRR